MLNTEDHNGKLLIYIIGLFVGSLLLGALTAPHLFNGLIRLGRVYENLEALRDLEFERIASRCVLFFLIVGLCLMLKKIGPAGFSVLNLRPHKGWQRSLARGWGVGLLSMGVLVMAGYLLQVYQIDADAHHGVIFKMAGSLVGALFVGVIEEVLFRGVIFNALRLRWGFFVGAILSSLFFSAVHFAKPEPAVGVVYGHWYAGLSLLPHIFTLVGSPYHYFPFMITLFVMGMMLCAFCDAQRHLFFVIGLHAGWVWIIKMGVDCFERNTDIYLPLFGYSGSVAKSYAALYAAVVLLLIALLYRKRKRS